MSGPTDGPRRTPEFARRETDEGEVEVVVLGATADEAFPDPIYVTGELWALCTAEPRSWAWTEDERLVLDPANGHATYRRVEVKEAEGHGRVWECRRVDNPRLDEVVEEVAT